MPFAVIGVKIVAGVFGLFSLIWIMAWPAQAAEKKLGRFGVWNAYAYDEGGQNVCYMVAVHPAATHARRSSYLMVTHRPVEASTDTFSYGAGTDLRTRSNVRLTIGSAVFDLFSAHDSAWSRDGLTDHKIARALTKAISVKTTAQPAKRGMPVIKDDFNVQGAAAAYLAISKACGLIPAKPPKQKFFHR